MDDETDAGAEHTGLRMTAMLVLSMLLASLGTSIANIALPTLANAFAAPFTHVQAVVVGYLAALTVTSVLAGRFGDRHGLLRVHRLGLALFAAASLAAAFAPTLPLLVAARIAQGAGAAFLTTLGMALMREALGSDRLGRAMGLLGTVSALGTALGPTLGGVVIPLAGWRSIFLLQVPLAVAALLLATGTSGGKMPPRPAATSPLLAGPQVALLPNLAVNLLVAAVMMTTLVVGPFYLTLGLGLSPATAGLAMSVGPAISILSGVPAGRAVDFLGTGRVLGGGLALIAGGALLLAALPPMAGIVGYVVAIAVLTPGYQLFQAANNTAALAAVAAERRGTAAGLLALSRNAGLILGASAMGAVFMLAAGGDDFTKAAPAAIIAGASRTFLLGSAMIVAAMVIAAWPARHAVADG
ncbi:MFS transporter [Kaistia geumhonensis]|uniref:MFS family permease n=1 Tax=Kaistia geumhonensis TaxID=410839 RepID=A0ABU0M6H7_9HYPH|nr:MFS transporter [Kaistia geumhonensis]MCX5478217.1 MFS transporter [Kaistia geumhonensis]MDQ0516567.1 MFS family permease [Kaistia geumhonensis]